MTNLETFVYWISERESVRLKKEAGKPKPWTDDPILRDYKFCNVEREQDRVTKWIKEQWRSQHATHPNLWFAMVVARLFNWPDTLQTIGFPTINYPALKEGWRSRLKHSRDVEHKKIFTGAYLVSTNGTKMDKIDYILDVILDPIWANGKSPAALGADSLEAYWNHLITFNGLGSFMSGQVVADLKYIDPVLIEAIDWWTFAPLGPGSKRGLNRVFERPLTNTIRQETALVEFRELQKLVERELNWLLPAHDIQNCCCEVDKYLRVKNNEGEPRSKYPGAK
jgi:hypothetical protein